MIEVIKMILYKNIPKKIKKHPIKEMKINIEEKPERPLYVFRKNTDRKNYINYVKQIIRSSPEYRSYVEFLKRNCGMDHDDIMPKIKSENGKRYSIELHHDPFSLFEIIHICLTKSEMEGEPHNPFKLAEDVMLLHYDNKVGLINLAKTTHELAEKGKIFIPLQRIRQRYDLFYNEYEEYMESDLKERIKLKIQMSNASQGKYVSPSLTTEFVYVDIEGFEYPEVPDDWGKLLDAVDIEKNMGQQ